MAPRPCMRQLLPNSSISSIPLAGPPFSHFPFPELAKSSVTSELLHMLFLLPKRLLLRLCAAGSLVPCRSELKPPEMPLPTTTMPASLPPTQGLMSFLPSIGHNRVCLAHLAECLSLQSGCGMQESKGLRGSSSACYPTDQCPEEALAPNPHLVKAAGFHNREQQHRGRGMKYKQG